MAKRDELYGEEDREAGFLNNEREQRNIPYVDAVRIYFNSVRKYPLLRLLKSCIWQRGLNKAIRPP